MFYQDICHTRIGLFDSIYAFQSILNVLLERMEPFNTVQGILYVPIVLLESIDLIVVHYAGIIILCSLIML